MDFLFIDHQHIDNQHTHADSGHSHPYGDYMSSFGGNWCPLENGHLGPAHADTESDRFDCNQQRTSSTSNAAISTVSSGIVGSKDDYRYAPCITFQII